MILNGPEGSIKGHAFDVNKPDSLPRYVRQNPNPDQQIEQAMALNERFRIVEKCAECKRALIAEEVQAHKMNHVPGPLRALVRTLMAANPEERKDVIGWVKKLEAK